jgi:penicillin-binding protein 1C
MTIDKVTTAVKIILAMGITLFLLFLLLNTLYPLDVKRLYKPQSTRIYEKDGHLMRVRLSEDGFLRIPLRPDEITDDIRKTLLTYEDKYFYTHIGINPISIGRALWFNLRNKRMIGASTITMQLARMMHHQPRTLKNKLIELFMALQLEYSYSKDTILTLYLSNAPYGGNIEGFASAAFAYFDLPAGSLSQAQIAYLVSIPKNPNLNSPKELKRVNRLKKRVLSRLYESAVISPEVYQRAKAERLHPSRRPLPHFAPHLAGRIKGKGDITTTIDLELQQKVQKLVKERVASLKPLHINNGAAIVIDNKSMEILAYVGSQDFNDKKYGGEVDGVNALFSPGSTLKPFVYAKALEKGLITPLKKLYDLPLTIAGYKPQNYNERYLGEVTAKEALQLSLNIPAVELDRLLEEDSLYEVLKEANITSINRSKAYYGSSLTLGGCGITLKDLAQLFAVFANGGVYRQASFLAQKKVNHTKRILSKEASYLISQILMDAPREAFSNSWQYVKDIPMVAFKTGTSARAKDLLCIGYTPEYTVAVWYGNFDGKESKKRENGKRMTGLEAASPTLQSIFKVLQPKKWFEKPKGIVIQSVCQDTIQTGQCKSMVEDKVIKGVERRVPCRLLRAEVLAKMIEHHTVSSMDDLSSHECYEIWKSYKPLISNPVDKQKYVQNRLLPQYLKKMALQCYSFENNTTIHWLIDNELPFKGHSGDVYYRYFTPGIHQISCLDEGAKMRSIEVEMEEM